MSALVSRMRPAMMSVASIRPADLELPVTHPIDITHLMSTAATAEGTG